jgi:hypothetical protein
MEAQKLPKSDLSPFQLSLRIRHPSVDPAVLSRELKIEADHSFRAGAPRPSRSGLAPAGCHSESYWLATLNPAAWLAGAAPKERQSWALVHARMETAVNQSLGGALSLTALYLRRSHLALLDRLKAEGGQVSLLIALTPALVSSFSLAPDAGRIFGELGITLEFELADD